VALDMGLVNKSALIELITRNQAKLVEEGMLGAGADVSVIGKDRQKMTEFQKALAQDKSQVAEFDEILKMKIMEAEL